MTAAMRMRLRVRTDRGFTSDETERSFTFENHDVTLKHQKRDEPLTTPGWMIFGATGFKTTEAATAFGDKLRTAIGLASVEARHGFDTGRDNATSWFNEDYARELGMLPDGHRILPNIHGVMAYPDDGRSSMFSGGGFGTITANLDAFLNAVSTHEGAPVCPPALLRALRILNAAILNNRPLAKLAMAVGVVEGLATDEPVPDSQKQAVKRLRGLVAADTSISEDDGKQIEKALNNANRLSIADRIRRLILQAGMQHIQHDWTQVYNQRSAIFHGSASMEDADVQTVADKAFDLAGAVVLKLLQDADFTLAPQAAVNFPALTTESE